ncbi:hypothetical protein OQA88_7105 [Cercophora sp. LCS_1]
MAMHYGQGAAAAAIRAIMAWKDVRGPFADFMFAGIRLLTDQTLENWTGADLLSWTWPVEEQIVDILHKALFAFTAKHLGDRRIKREFEN